jgi:hypothetical protein
LHGAFNLSSFQLTVFYLNIAATAALIVRLLLSGLYAPYRCLFIYLGVDLTESVMAAVFRHNGFIYGIIYYAGQGLKMILAVLVVLELYRLALAGQPTLASYGRKTVSYVLTGAAAVALLGLAIDRTVPPGRPPFLYRFLSFERTMDVCLFIFLLLIIAFMTWFPVRMKQNVALYIGGFVLYFLARASGLLLINILPPQYTNAMSNVMLSISLTCLVVWLIALRREGEQAITVVGHRWNPAATERLITQLEAINASLLRLSRR